MADAVICTEAFGSFFNDTILPLTGLGAIVTGVLIGLAFMVGRAIANAKLTTWAKTELLQVIISIATIFFLLTMVNAFCIINMGEVASFFEAVEDPHDLSLYDAAQTYLHEAALYSHNAMTVVRYHLEAYTILAYLNAFLCDFNVGGVGLGCWFGYSGENVQPVGGYGAINAALNIFFNSSIIAHLSALNFLFILLFVYKGFVFLFLPMGIFLRSMPYLRRFGALLIAVALSFLIVYPLMLSIFYLMGDVLVDRPGGGQCLACASPCADCYVPEDGLKEYLDETVFPDLENTGVIQSMGSVLLESISFGTQDTDALIREMYFPDGADTGGAIMFAAYAFIAAVFLPTTALLATIASISYIARLYGEEINLSRITQLV